MLTVVTRFPQQIAAQWRQDLSSVFRPHVQGAQLAFSIYTTGDWRSFWQSMALIPVFPALGYYGMDQTGISAFLVSHNLIPNQILGEGFGHVGLCFSLHYVVSAGQAFYTACRQQNRYIA